MKREFDFRLGAESEVGGSLGHAREPLSHSQSQASSSLVQVGESAGSKRLKVTKVNGYIVYSRTKKSRINGFDDDFRGNLENKRLKSSDEPRNYAKWSAAEENRKNAIALVKRTVVEGENVVSCSMAVENRIGGSAEVESFIDESAMVDTVIEESPLVDKSAIEGSLEVEAIEVLEESQLDVLEEQPTGYLKMPVSNEEPVQFLAEDAGSEGATILIPKSSEGKNDLAVKSSTKFTRSSLKLKVETLESLDCEVQAVENEVVPYVDGEAAAEGSELATPRKNLELKMSKKIALNKCPMTVKELFDTGLLEGVPVVYMGTISSKTAGLRGIIKDGGILCSCSLCKGRRVVPPSQFEIHACKQYKRAAQYICFENGKSLLEVLRTCRRRPLHMLEATIQSIISALPEEKFFTCRRCKGIFPIAHVGQIGPLCNSCVESKRSHGSLSSSTSTGARSQELVLVQPSLENSPVGISSQDHDFRSPQPVMISQSSASLSVGTSSQNKRQWKIARKSSELNVTSMSPKCPSTFISSQKKSPWKTARKSRKPAMFTNCYKSASVPVSLQNKKQWKTPKKSTKSVLISKSFKSGSPHLDSQNRSQLKMTTKDQRLHKLVFEEGGLPDGTEVAYYARGQRLLEGYKKGFGIFCRCCNSEVSPSQFEAHAGWASRRKPYAYIYTSNGVSLHELALSLSKGRRYSAKDNDDVCIICADGGNLLLCDGCPRAFHKECASLPTVPRGRWYCKYCQNMFLREKFVEHNANAVAAGRVLGVDAIDQITRRCIRIVKNIEAELSGCVLCRASDFSKSGFGPRTIILCDQCEKEFHVGCLRSHKMADLKELPRGKWFCCKECYRIHSVLQNLLVRDAEKLPDSLLDAVKRKYEEKGLDASISLDVRWRLLSGKFASPETRLLLSQAVSIFHECFNPIVDVMTGRDLIPCMVYGRNLKGQEYGGMYCAVLTVNSLVVSAGILRVFGQEIAELPLVATSIGNQSKGYFQLLFSCIEKLLAFLNVKNLVLPAAEEAESIWTNKFGFKKLRPDQLIRYRRSCCQMVTFKGTSMLQKQVPECRILDNSEEPVESCNEVE